jgi:uncharacterized membrane protein YqaE (UPF0057 family)
MKVKLMTMIAAIAVLSSCTNLRYTDYGKPFDFLKAKRDVVKPQGKVEVETVQVENNKKSNDNTITAETKTIENEVLVIENTIYDPSNEVLTVNETENTAIAIEETIPTKKDSKKSTDKTTTSTTNNGRMSPISRKVEKIVASRIEKIIPEGLSNSSVDSDVMFIIALILAFLIPPLAVYLVDGVTNRFWLNLVLFLLAIGIAGALVSVIGSLTWLLMLIAIVHALLIVLGEI